MTREHKVGFNPRDDIGTVRWFGRHWGAPICEARTHVPTPTTRTCGECALPLTEVDRGAGIPYVTAEGPGEGADDKGYIWFHYHCFMRQVLGNSSVAPQPCDYGRRIGPTGASEPPCPEGVYEDTATNLLIVTKDDLSDIEATLHLCDDHVQQIEERQRA